MRAVEIIQRKRDGGELTREEIRWFVSGYSQGAIPDYQMSALCMAILLKGFSPEETGHLTWAMIDSGEVFDLSGIQGALVDKHSTGGVGDKISLVLAPLAAACGLKVPMMSGRALGHTGGTLDKLDSIKGYSTSLTLEQIREGLESIGFIMTGQSKDVVPADRKMYALRDVTGTVESIPLITASILSKKFAEGAQHLVFDVKCGPGAFMKTEEEARALAKSLVDTGKALERDVAAIITRMEEPIGRMTGNFLEVEESYRCLQGEGPEDTMTLVNTLTAWMVKLGGVAETFEEALALVKEKLASGEAMERFKANVIFQGGDWDELVREIGQRRSYYFWDVKSPKNGYIEAIDAFKVGLLGVRLGVGRNKTDDPVNPNVGMEFFKKVGDPVAEGDILCRIYSEDDEKLGEAHAHLLEAYRVSDQQPEIGPLIIAEIV
jgi:pyrimidine-nucleoside phosphorylase